jgi:hypothetical protein
MVGLGSQGLRHSLYSPSTNTTPSELQPGDIVIAQKPTYNKAYKVFKTAEDPFHSPLGTPHPTNNGDW